MFSRPNQRMKPKSASAGYSVPAKIGPGADCYADLQVPKHNGLGSLARSRVFCRNCIA
jgi:hypothetical protein